MATQPLETIEVSDNPALRELVEEVVRTGRPKLLRVNGSEAEVVVRPAEPGDRQKQLTPEERERLWRASFGAWKGLIDPDKLKRELRELQRDDKEPRTW